VTGTYDAIHLLQQWYLEECNGDWEHSFGVHIETLDNPGWLVTIDLEETSWAKTVVPRARVERSQADWLQWEVTNSKFIGAGGPRNLKEIIEQFFRAVIDPSKGESNGPGVG